jgi:hypothetical protein
MSPETHDSELAALAQALVALAPAAGRLDRDQLLFRAGQASLRRQIWLWPSVAAVLALLLGTVGLLEVLHPVPQQVQCTIYQRVEPPASPTESLVAKLPAPQDTEPSVSQEVERAADPLSYLRMRRLVVAWGVDALPNPRRSAGSAGPDALRSARPDILSPSRGLRMQMP